MANELGGGDPRAARLVVQSVMSLAVSEALLVSSTLFVGRSVLGHLFSNDEEVVKYVTSMAALICIGVVFDSLQCVLSGIARGCGWQDLGAFVNLGAYYFAGIPISVTLGFWFDFRGTGLWVGIVLGSFLQSLLLSLVIIFTNWENKVSLSWRLRYNLYFLNDLYRIDRLILLVIGILVISYIDIRIRRNWSIHGLWVELSIFNIPFQCFIINNCGL